MARHCMAKAAHGTAWHHTARNACTVNYQIYLSFSLLLLQVKYEPAAPVGNKSSRGLLPHEQGQEQQADAAAGAAADGGTAEPLFPHL